jgi:hypothetical protein
VRSTSIPSAKTASNAAVNVGITIADQEPETGDALADSHH